MSTLADARSIRFVEGSSTTVFEAPNKFTYRLPRSGFQSNRDEVALKSLTLLYSWSNISSEKGNNIYSYRLGGVEFPVVMADGIWSFADFNAYLQQVMKKNGHYLLDPFNTPVYFLTLTLNPTLYCLSLVADPVPATLPAGWTNPAELALTGLTPQLVVSTNIARLTGFPAGTYPAVESATKYYRNSGIPQISDVSSLNVLCNLVDNSGFSLSTNILANFAVPSGTQPGQLMQIQPNNPDWMPIGLTREYYEFTLEIVDQLNRPVVLRDPAGFVAVLTMRPRRN